MKDIHKTKKQLIDELEALRNEVASRESPSEADKELRATKDYLENIFTTSADGIMIADTEGYITMVNGAVERILGFPQEELIGKHTADLGLKGEEYSKGGRELIGKVVREGSASGIERTWIKEDGTSVAIEMNIALLKDGEGAVTGSVATIRDISERRRSEEALQRSESRYRELVENANSIILRMDCEGRVTFTNEFALRFFGFTEEEIVGKNVVGTIVPARESTGRDLKIMIEDIGRHPERYKNNENENMCSDGKRVWIAWTNRMVYNEDKHGKEILCIGNDITERKRAETILEERTHDLEERIKELRGLYAISTLSQQQDSDTAAIFLRMVDLIPPSFQYPRCTFARIVIQGDEYTSAGFTVSPWSMSVDIKIAGEKLGVVEVYYRGEIPEGCEGPFLQEEQALLDAIGEQIENVIQLREADKKLAHYQHQLRRMASQLSLAEESARRTFATYLHDQIGQTLFATRIKLEGLQARMLHLGQQGPFYEIIALLEQVINDTRTLTFEMSVPILYELGIEAALEWLVEQTNAQGDLAVTFRDDKQKRRIRDEVSVVLFRGVQELLTNVRKHAQARNVEIAVRGDGTQVLINVKDDGVGFSPEEVEMQGKEKYGFGLFSLRERLTLLGGYVSINSIPGRGTDITLMVPLIP